MLFQELSDFYMTLISRILSYLTSYMKLRGGAPFFEIFTLSGAKESLDDMPLDPRCHISETLHSTSSVRVFDFEVLNLHDARYHVSF
jgi:hypothetical protein